ncbi:MAG: MFS transporter [Thermostichales cyanobacterium BF4_bins_65]
MGSPDSAAAAQPHLLQNSNFTRLWMGQIFSQVADKVFLVLMIALTTGHVQAQAQGADSVSAWVAAIMVSSTIPAVLFGAVAGVFVDRWDKKGVLVLSNVLRGVLVLLVPLLLPLLDHTPTVQGIPAGFVLLLGITFGVSTLTQYFTPAEQAILPAVVRPHNLLAANSLCTTTMMVAVIMGFALGEPLLTLANHLASPWFGDSDLGAALLVGGSYVLAALWVVTVQARRWQGEPEEAEQGSPLSFADLWQDLRAGLAYLGQQPAVRAAMVLMISLYCVFAALAVLAVQMAEELPYLRASQFGVLLSAAGVGLAVGAFGISHWGSRLPRRQVSVAGATGMGVLLLLLAGAVHSLPMALGLIAGVGLCGACMGIPMQTLIQEETPPELRGKVFGLVNNLTNVALSVPLVLAGVAETMFGLQPVLLVLGVVTMGMGWLAMGMKGGDA